MAAKKGVPNPNAGRPKGSTNKVQPNVKVLASAQTTQALKTLTNIMLRSKNESNRIAAATQLLDRAHGKPTQAIGTEDNNPLPIKITWEK